MFITKENYNNIKTAHRGLLKRIASLENVVSGDEKNPFVGEVYLFVTYNPFGPENNYYKAKPGRENRWIKFRKLDLTEEHGDFAKIRGVWINKKECGFVYYDRDKQQREEIENRFKKPVAATKKLIEPKEGWIDLVKCLRLDKNLTIKSKRIILRFLDKHYKIAFVGGMPELESKCSEEDKVG